MAGELSQRAELYTTYPTRSVLLYTSATIFHLLLGRLGIAVGYGPPGPVWLFAALVVPSVAVVPALVLGFSVLLLAIFLSLVGLLLFRFFVIFTRIACIHCRAKFVCPQARAMGVREK